MDEYKEGPRLAERSLADIVLADSRSIRVMEKWGLDYCCGGRQTLSKACGSKGIEVGAVLEDLESIATSPKEVPEGPDPNVAPLDVLAEHIVAKHHAYVWHAIPEIERLLGKIAKVHGGSHPELHAVMSHFEALAGELTVHMRKEELILFPYIKKLAAAERGETVQLGAPFGTVESPVVMMREEHDRAGEELAVMRSLTKGYALPAGACMSYWQAFHLLEAFETDLHLHIHLENNALFPRAIVVEQQLETQLVL